MKVVLEGEKQAAWRYVAKSLAVVDFLIMMLMEGLLRWALSSVVGNEVVCECMFGNLVVFVGDGGGRITSHRPSPDVLLNPVNIVVLFFVTCILDLVNKTSHPLSHS